jgi:branched-chain amino acid transport system permease protein
MSLFVEEIFNAISLAGTYLLIALGVTLLYGITRIINFAQGELVSLGGFIAFALASLHVPIWAALVISTLLVAAGSEVLDFAVFRRTLTRPLNGFIVSLGLILVLEAAYALIWTAPVYSVPPLLGGTFDLGAGVVISRERVLLIAITAVVAALLFAILRYTKYGRGMRALSEDRTGARVLGVPVGVLVSVVFVLSTGLAAAAGGLLGTVLPFTTDGGTTLLLLGFAVAIVGGLGSIRGAVGAAILLALTQTLAGAYVSLEWSYAILLVVMIATILARPRTASGGGDPLAVEGIFNDTQLPAEGQDRRTRAVSRGLPRLSAVVLGVLVFLAPLILASARDVSLLSGALVNAIVAYSFWFCFRQVGLFSIAQGAFMGTGAYTAALVSAHLGLDFWLQIAVALVAAGLMAVLFGLISLRTTGSYFAILLFALNELFVQAVGNWSFTGQSSGLLLTQPPDALFGLVSFESPTAFYYLVLAVLIAAVVVLGIVRRSRFGRRLLSVRDNATLASSLGLNVFRHKLAALAIGGALAGVGGVLYAYQQLGVAPDEFSVSISITFVLMVILGGSESVAGPLVGALLATFLPDIFGLSPYVAQLVYGLVLVVVISLLPRGVTGSLRGGSDWLARTLTARSATPAGTVAGAGEGLAGYPDYPPPLASSSDGREDSL